MSGGTRTRRLIDLQLPGGLDAFVAARRPDRSWRLIARDIYDATGEDVTYETLRSWFPEHEVDDGERSNVEPLARSA